MESAAPSARQQEDNSCMYPDCPSHWIGDKLVAELKTIQKNQERQEELQKQMVGYQISHAALQTDITHVKGDLRKIDERIAEAFRSMEKKADQNDILPKETLVTKSDVGRMMLYTSGILTTIVVLIQIVGRIFPYLSGK